MVTLLSVEDYVVISLLLIISACLGSYFRFTGGRQRTTTEFLMAGRNMSILPVAFSLMATYMSSISMLGIPPEVYKYGTQYLIWLAGVLIGSLVAAYGLLPIFFDVKVSTTYEYLEKRYGKMTRTVASALYTLNMIFYIAVVLYAPSLALNAVTGLSTWTSVIALSAVCTFYCSMGGLKAVLWTDVFQSFLMYVTIIAVVIKGSIDVGGADVALRIANENGQLIFHKTSFDFTTRYTLWNSIIDGIIYSVDSFGTNQVQVQRMLSTGNVKKAKNALIGSLPLISLYLIFCYWDGVVIYANYHDCDPLMQPANVNMTSDQLLPYAILKMFGDFPGMPGLCIAGIFSASLSTISSAVNALTTMVMEDFIKPFCFCKQMSESWTTLLAKMIAVGYGGLCLLLTFFVATFPGIFEASIIFTGMINAPVLGLFFLGMFSTTANEEGSLIGLLAGMAMCAWIGFGLNSVHRNLPTSPRSTDGCSDLLNETWNFQETFNYTDFIHTGFQNVTGILSSSDQQEEYIFPLYKVAFTWIRMIGFTTVIIIGYSMSFLIGLWKTHTLHKPEHFSPFVRKFYFKSTAPNETSVECLPEAVSMLQISPINASPNARNLLLESTDDQEGEAIS